MRKETTICFRTTTRVRRTLDAMAREGGRSLSSTIELILADYLKKRGFSDRERVERRRYPRKQVNAAAYVRISGGDVTQHGGVVLDVSLGGIAIAVPKECALKISKGEKSPFEASFVFPSERVPVRVVCKPERVAPSNGTVYVGASFVDADFTAYQRLQQYLV